jgi:hypothetical protein
MPKSQPEPFLACPQKVSCALLRGDIDEESDQRWLALIGCDRRMRQNID